MDKPRVERISGVHDIPATAWNALGQADNLYLSHSWLRWADGDPAFHASHLLAWNDHGQLVGALPCYLWWRGREDSVNGWYDPVRVFIRPTASQPIDVDRWFPLLLLGSRSGYHGDVLVATGLPPSQQALVHAALLDAAADQATEVGARSRALMYVPETSVDQVQRLLCPVARAVPTSAEAVIGSGWDSFADYLRQFAKKRRTNIQREITTFETAGVTVQETTLGDSYQRIGPLLGRLQRKYGFTDTDEAMTDRMAAQAAALDDISRVFLELRDGQVVGFSLGYEWRGQFYVRSTGFDADGGSAPFAYFNLAVYRPLRHAIEHGLRCVNMGVSGYQAKVARGAVLAPLWSMVWPPADADPGSLAALAEPAAEAAEAESLVAGTFRVG